MTTLKMGTKRKKVKLLIALSKTVEDADKVIDEFYGFKSIGEKVAFLKGMFGVEIVGCQNNKPDKMAYFAMLNIIISERLI